jgi:hypothetical protein
MEWLKVEALSSSLSTAKEKKNPLFSSKLYKKWQFGISLQNEHQPRKPLGSMPMRPKFATYARTWLVACALSQENLRLGLQNKKVINDFLSHIFWLKEKGIKEGTW